MNRPSSPSAAACWDEQADPYARHAESMERAFEPLTRALLDAVGVGPGTTVLDLGCGPGHVIAAAQERGADALGVDLSPAMIAAARRRFPTARFVTGDMREPPNGPWDGITVRFAAHHVEASWLLAAFRVLRPGGRIALAETGPESRTPAQRSEGKRPPTEWRRLLGAAGFVGLTMTEVIVHAPAGIVDHDGAPRGWPRTWIIGGRRP